MDSGKENSEMKEKTVARWTTVLAIAGALTAGGVVAMPGALQEETDGLWQRGPGLRGNRPGFFMRGGLFGRLNLTDEQRDQLRELQQKQFDATVKEREALFDARRAFQEAVRAGDESGIYAAAQDLAEAEAALAIVRAGHRERMLEILTPEQRQEWEDILAEAEAAREKRLELREERLRDRRPMRLDDRFGRRGY